MLHARLAKLKRTSCEGDFTIDYNLKVIVYPNHAVVNEGVGDIVTSRLVDKTLDEKAWLKLFNSQE